MGLRLEENSVVLAETKNYTVSEEKYVKFVIFSILEDVNNGLKEFNKLENNERFIEQIVKEVYENDAKNVPMLLHFINLLSEIGKKYKFYTALYEIIIVRKDNASTEILYITLSELKSLQEDFSNFEIACQKNIVLMITVLDMLICKNGSSNDQLSLPGNKSSKHPENREFYIAKLRKIKFEIETDKMIEDLQFYIIYEEKKVINEWTRKLSIYEKQPIIEFQKMMDIARNVREIEADVHINNQKMLIDLKNRITDDIKMFIWSGAFTMKMKYYSCLFYLSVKTGDKMPPVLDCQSYPSKPTHWIFESIESEEGMYLKHLESQAYIYFNYCDEIKLMQGKKNSEYLRWKLQKGNTGYIIVNIGNKKSFRVNLSSDSNKYIIDKSDSSHQEWTISK